ncbi:MAG: hypothetical protein ACOZQL_02540 [Myxococcota bacterium]
MTRRGALRVLGVGVGVAGLLSSSGCRDCSEATVLDPGSRSIRAALKYVESSNLPGKACKTCQQYIAGAYGTCGGCRLFAGGVNPGGVC